MFGDAATRNSFLRSHKQKHTDAFVIMRVLLAAASAALVISAPAADVVTSLPGWEGPLPMRHWSGFLDGGIDVQDGITYAKKMWYMAAECEAADPTTCPVIIFSNGGPGAPSEWQRSESGARCAKIRRCKRRQRRTKQTTFVRLPRSPTAMPPSHHRHLWLLHGAWSIHAF